jgi:hypothetical protein
MSDFDEQDDRNDADELIAGRWTGKISQPRISSPRRSWSSTV